jgi:hypothetical protein
MMSKSKFLEEISRMDRDQIREILESKNAKKKPISPVYFVRLPKDDKRKTGDKNG